MWVQVIDEGDSVLANGRRVVKAISNHFCEWYTQEDSINFDSKIFSVSSTKTAVKITLLNDPGQLKIWHDLLYWWNIDYLLNTEGIIFLYYDVRLMSNRIWAFDELVHEWTFTWESPHHFY